VAPASRGPSRLEARQTSTPARRCRGPSRKMTIPRTVGWVIARHRDRAHLRVSVFANGLIVRNSATRSSSPASATPRGSSCWGSCWQRWRPGDPRPLTRVPVRSGDRDRRQHPVHPVLPVSPRRRDPERRSSTRPCSWVSSWPSVLGESLGMAQIAALAVLAIGLARGSHRAGPVRPS
jgi:hypothetical protein